MNAMCDVTLRCPAPTYWYGMEDVFGIKDGFPKKRTYSPFRVMPAYQHALGRPMRDAFDEMAVFFHSRNPDWERIVPALAAVQEKLTGPVPLIALVRAYLYAKSKDYKDSWGHVVRKSGAYVDADTGALRVCTFLGWMTRTREAEGAYIVRWKTPGGIDKRGYIENNTNRRDGSKAPIEEPWGVRLVSPDGGLL